MNIGTRIKQRRKAMKLNQSDVAKAVGVSREAVSQWEGGGSKGLKQENLLACAKALKTNVEWLVTGKGNEDAEMHTLSGDIYSQSANMSDSQFRIGDKESGTYSSGSPTELQSMHNHISLDSSKLAWSLEVMDQVLARTYDDPSNAEYDTRADVFAVAWREVNRDPQITQLKKETAVRYVEQQLEANNNG